MKADTIVVIPSREKDHGFNCLSFERMLQEKLAQGFIGAADRISQVQYIAIVDKGNKAYFADISEVRVGVPTDKELNTNDIYFDNVRSIPLSVLADAGIDVNNGRCSIRYAALAHIVSKLTKADTELLSLFG